MKTITYIFIITLLLAACSQEQQGHWEYTRVQEDTVRVGGFLGSGYSGIEREWVIEDEK